MIRKIIARIIHLSLYVPIKKLGSMLGGVIDLIYPEGTQTTMAIWLQEDGKKVRLLHLRHSSCKDLAPEEMHKMSIGMPIDNWLKIVAGINKEIIWQK